MNRLVEINGHEIEIKEYKGQRVVTFKDIDTVHERPEGTARKRFNDNRKHLVEGEDFFKISPSEFRTALNMEMDARQQNDITLITETGYLMLVKSLSDDLAWDVQRKLVKAYFWGNDIFENMSQELKAVIVVDQRVTAVEKRVDYLENDIPLYGSEADQLSRIVKKKGVSVLGGKSSNAYKDNKLRSEVYTDIYNQVKREYGLYDADGRFVTYKALKRKYFPGSLRLVESYIPPEYLQEKIKDYNAQCRLDE